MKTRMSAHLMDAAYDSPQIHESSKYLRYRSIVDSNPGRGEKVPLDPATKTRFAKRSNIERVNSSLKDNFLIGSIYCILENEWQLNFSFV